MVRIGVATVAGLGIVELLTAHAFILAARIGHRPAVRVGPVGRFLRWQRSVVLRIACAWAAWPHVVDVAVGTPSTPVAPTPSTEVHRVGPTTLHRYRRDTPPTKPEPVLVVHSLVTRPWVLDLTPERTLVGTLLGAGYDVWLLDWGAPSPRDASRGLDDCARIAHDCRSVVSTVTGRERVHVLGYCLGGTVATIDAATWEPQPASLVLVAPVIDTGVGGETWAPHGIARYVAHPWLHCGLVLDHDGLVPAELVREAFHALRPRALRTVWQRLRMPDVPELGRAYGAMARWSWEQVELAGATFLDVVALYRTNALVNGRWRIGDGTVDLRAITAPTLVTASERDHIVPPDSAVLPAARVERVAFPGGHVGMVVGNQAPNLYTTIVAFLDSQQPGARAPLPAERTGDSWLSPA